MIEDFQVGPDHVRIGVVLYNSTARVFFNFEEFDTTEEYISAINSLPKPNGQTNYAEAFRVTRNKLLGSTGDRPTVPNVCIFITDGLSTREIDATEDEAALLRPHCTLITVAVGNKTDGQELQRIASDNRFFKVFSFELLDSIQFNLTEAACNVPEVPVGKCFK